MNPLQLMNMSWGFGLYSLKQVTSIAIAVNWEAKQRLNCPREWEVKNDWMKFLYALIGYSHVGHWNWMMMTQCGNDGTKQESIENKIVKEKKNEYVKFKSIDESLSMGQKRGRGQTLHTLWPILIFFLLAWFCSALRIRLRKQSNVAWCGATKQPILSWRDIFSGPVVIAFPLRSIFAIRALIDGAAMDFRWFLQLIRLSTSIFSYVPFYTLVFSSFY